MNESLIYCKCGHMFGEHSPFGPENNRFEDKFCSFCPCIEYRQDNLRLLETLEAQKDTSSVGQVDIIIRSNIGQDRSSIGQD